MLSLGLGTQKCPVLPPLLQAHPLLGHLVASSSAAAASLPQSPQGTGDARDEDRSPQAPAACRNQGAEEVLP